MLRARKIKRQKGNNTFLLMLWTFWIRIQEWVKHKKNEIKEFFRDKMRTRQEHKILWRKGIEIFWSVKHSNRQSKWSKHCENKIHAIIISTNNLFFSVYLRIKSDHLDMFFCFFFSMDITFYWHSYLLLDFLLLRLTSFIPFFHIAMLYHRLPTYLPKKKIFSCSSSLFLLLV